MELYDQKQGKAPEMRMLATLDLDITELEQRLELATAMYADCWGNTCSVDQCTVHCCVANSCTGDAAALPPCSKK